MNRWWSRLIPWSRPTQVEERELTHEMRMRLAALFLHVDYDAISDGAEMVISDALPVVRAGRDDIVLQTEAGSVRTTAVAPARWGELHASAGLALVALESRLASGNDVRITYGEVYVMKRRPRKPRLPRGYSWAKHFGSQHPDVAAWLDTEPSIGVSHRGTVVAAVYPRPNEGTPFVGSPVCVVEAHRGRGLARCLIAAQATLIWDEGTIPTALISDDNIASRTAFRSIGYSRALTVGALSVEAGDSE